MALDGARSYADLRGARDFLRAHPRCNGKVAIVGFSLGGAYARHLAAARPDAMRNTIMLGSPLEQGHVLFEIAPLDRYRVVLSDFFNMSDLASNASYSGPGGATGRLNQADVDALLVWTLPDLP